MTLIDHCMPTNKIFMFSARVQHVINEQFRHVFVYCVEQQINNKCTYSSTNFSDDELFEYLTSETASYFTLYVLNGCLKYIFSLKVESMRSRVGHFFYYILESCVTCFG